MIIIIFVSIIVHNSKHPFLNENVINSGVEAVVCFTIICTSLQKIIIEDHIYSFIFQKH